MRSLIEQVRQGLMRAGSLEEGAQLFSKELASALPQSVVLARTYVAMPFYRLPAKEQAFAAAIAKDKGTAARLHDETPVLTLLGSFGTQSEWRDRRNSKGHVAIPLTDARTVESVPMVASLLRSLGVELGWFDVPREVYVRRLVGGMNGVFFVKDARSSRDDQGRLIIPARDFVQQHGVKTVFGVGGSYLNGWLAASIFFTKTQMEHQDADAFIPVGTAFKLGTMQLVATGRIFNQ